MQSSPEPPPTNDGLEFERLKLALRASSEGIWDWQVEKNEIYYSPRVLEFLGCAPGDCPNVFQPPYDAIHEEDHDAF